MMKKTDALAESRRASEIRVWMRGVDKAITPEHAATRLKSLAEAIACEAERGHDPSIPAVAAVATLLVLLEGLDAGRVTSCGMGNYGWR